MPKNNEEPQNPHPYAPRPLAAFAESLPKDAENRGPFFAHPQARFLFRQCQIPSKYVIPTTEGMMNLAKRPAG